VIEFFNNTWIKYLELAKEISVFLIGSLFLIFCLLSSVVGALTVTFLLVNFFMM